MDQLPTIEDLLVWAGEIPAHIPVGKVAKPLDCPLACYLDEHTQGSWVVGNEGIRTPGDELLELPDHLQSIIFLVDCCPGCENGYIYPPAFIHILQTVQERMKEGV